MYYLPSKLRHQHGCKGCFDKIYMYSHDLTYISATNCFMPLGQSSVDRGHISLYGAIQSLKLGSFPDEDFDTTIDHFNAV